MTVDVRERVLARLEAVVAAVSGLNFAGRNVPFELGSVELPAAVLYDGSERPTNTQTGVTEIETDASVLLAGVASGQATIGPVINLLAATAKATILADPTLGGGLGVSDVEWRSTDGPIIDGDPGAPPYASIVLTFAILRQEAERDPFDPA